MVKLEMLLTKGSKRRSGKPLKEKRGVTVHNVGNHDRGANARANAQYQKNTENQTATSWHWTVDENEVICSIPSNEIAEHSGKRAGNDTTVGIEICDNADGDILQATLNGAQLAGDELRKMGYVQAVWKENIFQHNDWSGKNCPEDIRAGRPFGWAEFIAKVNEFMGAAETTGPQQPTFHYSEVLKNGSRGDDVAILQNNLNTLGYGDYEGKDLKTDGVFGKRTEFAVEQFQNDQGLKVDGKVGENTTTAMGGVWESK